MTQLELEPNTTIDPTTQVQLMPGIDAKCETNRAHDCQYPFCTCHCGRKDSEDK